VSFRDSGLVFVGGGGEGDELLFGVVGDLEYDVLKLELAEVRGAQPFGAGA